MEEELNESYKLSGVKRIAIIGAGNAGITCAKYLLAERAFERVDILEQRSHVGGLWIYTPENDEEAYFSIPQTIADAPLDTPIWREVKEKHQPNGAGNGDSSSGPEPTFLSPLYERLEANLPKTIMRHSDLAFAEDEQLFPTQEAILKHLERYADDVRHLIQFETQVQDVRSVRRNCRTIWLVRTRNLLTAEETVKEYDAVAISSGHFNVPYVPDIAGVREWRKAYPRSISHSKHFRRPEEFANQKVIAIGRGYSGLDIAHQLASVVSPPLHISTHVAGSADPDGKYVHHPEISEFLPDTPSTRQAVRFADGHVEKDVDHIIFCTGYLYSFPYLQELTNLSGPTLNDKSQDGAHEPPAPIITDGSRPRNLYQYMLYNRDPTLAVLSMPQQIVPFPIAEAQSAVISRLWSGRLSVPSQADMERWEQDTVAERGDGKKWLWLKSPLDGQYLNFLAGWAASADLEGPGDSSASTSSSCRANDAGIKGNGNRPKVGKAPPRWGEKELWIRARVLDLKKAFVARGPDRTKVKSMEELGFEFEAWKRENPDSE